MTNRHPTIEIAYFSSLHDQNLNSQNTCPITTKDLWKYLYTIRDNINPENPVKVNFTKYHDANNMR